jgi:predicted O-methyltransferase YrrM
VQSQQIIDEIYRDRAVTAADGTKYPLHSHLDVAEGGYLARLIADHADIARTLEVGCAFGLSSLHMCGATAGRPNAHHIMVDPFQSTDWKGIGVRNLDRAGIDFYELREEPSEFGLPNLLQEGVEPLDLVFIDGWHSFDHTLLDLFYAIKLVRVGGYIVVDDANWPSVAKAVSYVSNYPCLEIIGGGESTGIRLLRRAIKLLKPLAETIFPHWLYDQFYARGKFPSTVALRKVSNDERSFDWYRSF